MYRIPYACIWKYRAEPDAGSDGVLRLYERRKKRIAGCFYALLYMYIGYTNGKFNRIFYPEDIKLPMALIIISDLFYGVTCYILLFLMRTRFHFSYYFIHIILPEIVYTTFITIFLYPIILWINQRLEDREQRSAKKFV